MITAIPQNKKCNYLIGPCKNEYVAFIHIFHTQLSRASVLKSKAFNDLKPGYDCCSGNADAITTDEKLGFTS